MSTSFACGHARTHENSVLLGAAGARCRKCRADIARRGGLAGTVARTASRERDREPDEDTGPARAMSPDDIAHRVVDRNPCPRCGVRKDRGCEHTASSLTVRP